MVKNEIGYDSGQLAVELFGDTDLKMLRLAMSPVITQEELDSVLEGWDAGTAPFKSLTIASNLANSHPEVSFPKEALAILQKARISCRKDI